MKEKNNNNSLSFMVKLLEMYLDFRSRVIEKADIRKKIEKKLYKEFEEEIDLTNLFCCLSNETVKRIEKDIDELLEEDDEDEEDDEGD